MPALKITCKIIIPSFIAMLVVMGCGEPGAAVDKAGKQDSTVINNTPASVSADTTTMTPMITAFEMADDSVFTDGSVPSSWANAGFTDVKGFKLFLKQLQIWVMDNNKEKLASVIKYPLNSIKNPEELVAAYDAIFTKEVKLSFATINFSQIFRRDKGAMTEAGKVWFAQFGKEFKIIAINN